MEGTKGKYEREDVFDSELQQMFGERYHDATNESAGETCEGDTAYNTALNKVKAFAGLILGDGLLVYMLMSGKIDDLFGVLFVAGVSAVCGYCLK